MLMKSHSTSKLAIIKFVLNCLSSSQNKNESLIMNWLYVSGSNNGTKKIASLQVGVLIVDNIGRKDGTPSTIL